MISKLLPKSALSQSPTLWLYRRRWLTTVASEETINPQKRTHGLDLQLRKVRGSNDNEPRAALPEQGFDGSRKKKMRRFFANMPKARQRLPLLQC
ncbi:hypothetical protein Slin15195_G041620 [Septoria linicola]|uniref:Uncharacterized protein n=1 Tax=Septoria linicola TaxID=215465 RepID=A0A9Q9APP1_9PEZI|nr:hypothetical protein Slin14017_G045130 [Septoria linicola]USW50843.1 hypothetical protein Slin15195_G041620 [Septoria linicola]